MKPRREIGIDLPIRYCSDRAVQKFIEAGVADMDNPYEHMTAHQLFAAARARFGDMRCWDLTIWRH
jgi:hypothetical protein